MFPLSARRQDRKATTQQPGNKIRLQAQTTEGKTAEGMFALNLLVCLLHVVVGPLWAHTL
eukprot:568223-Heterocapsa_arctica.AAC.1